MELKDRQDWQSVLDSTDTFLFDCDGEKISRHSFYLQRSQQVFYGRATVIQCQEHRRLLDFFRPRCVCALRSTHRILHSHAAFMRTYLSLYTTVVKIKYRNICSCIFIVIALITTIVNLFIFKSRAKLCILFQITAVSPGKNISASFKNLVLK